MPRGTLRLLCNCFRPWKRSAKDAPLDSNGVSEAPETRSPVSEGDAVTTIDLQNSGDFRSSTSGLECNCQVSADPSPSVVTAPECSFDALCGVNSCILTVLHSSPLPAIPEHDECSDQTQCGVRPASSSSPVDRCNRISVERASAKTQPPSCSGGENGAGSSGHVGSRKQSVQDPKAVNEGCPPISVSFKSQDSINEDDKCHNVEDIWRSIEGYEISKDKVAGEPNVRFAVDSLSKEKVILILYRSDIHHDHHDFFRRFENCRHLPNLLNTIRIADGGCVLVLERCDFTLSEWIKRHKHNQASQKEELSKILRALVCLHNQGGTCENLKPSTLMWFSSDRSWKFLGPYLELDVLPRAFDSYSRQYTAPELLSKGRWQSKAHRRCSAAMWSFGVIAFEVLSGKRFHGPRATLQVVVNYLIGREPLPSLSRIRHPAAVTLIKKLLSLEPSKRPTAKEALESTFFKSAESSSTTQANMDGGQMT